MARLVYAQQRNAVISGSDLVAAAKDVATVARRHDAVLIAHDQAGERIIGAALALYPEACRPADLTVRRDGAVVLMVSGVSAAPRALIQTVDRMHSLGAAAVHVAVLDADKAEDILGAATVTRIGPA